MTNLDILMREETCWMAAPAAVSAGLSREGPGVCSHPPTRVIKRKNRGNDLRRNKLKN